jgi:NAD(P)H dehydrogenase (quinone)
MEPFVAYGVEAGIQYSDNEVIEQRLKKIPEELISCLRTRESAKPLYFNMMRDWNATGRIKASAQAHSPFIRHKKDIDLG